MDKQKLSIIGGGSPYVPGIIYSVAHSASDLDGMELCLMDISDLIHELAPESQ